jgi:hypothetical protein
MFALRLSDRFAKPATKQECKGGNDDGWSYVGPSCPAIPASFFFHYFGGFSVTE